MTIKRARVWVLNVNPGQVSDEFAHSYAAMLAADRVNGWNCLIGPLWARSGPNIAKARNDLVTRFLDDTDGDWALFVDSDMVFPDNTVMRLLMAAVRADTKIIGGLCVRIDPGTGPTPTIFQHAGDTGPVTIQNVFYPEDTLLQVAATGTGCLMIHRDVLQAIRDASEDKQFCWFLEEARRGAWVGEDIWFCLRAGELGFKVYVDTTLPIGHAKYGRVWWPSDISTGVGVPARPLVAVIPTKFAAGGSSTYVADLVAQLVEQGETAEIIVIDNECSDDEREGRNLEATVLAGAGMGIHEMWNLGATYAFDKHGHRVHIAFLNDDLRIGPGFMGTMSRALGTDPTLVAVSGNYDGRPVSRATLGLANEPVQEVHGICAGRYDGTGGLAGFAFMTIGTLFTSGYRFPEDCKWWYGDNDLVATIIKGDGKVGIALRAEVEHLDGGGRTAGDWFDPSYAAQLAADRVAFEAKWAPKPVDDFSGLYDHVVSTPSDINEHLPTLYRLAVDMKARDIVELGTRTGVSTVAWCHAADQTGGRVWAVDIVDRLVFQHPRLTFLVGDDLADETLAKLPERADIVFVDTLHSYEQTAAEIAAYKGRVRPGGCMVFHDTSVAVHEHLGADQPPFPTRLAVDEWVEAEGLKFERWENNNGLTVVWLPEEAA